MIRGIILTIVVLAILSYYGFDLNVIVHSIVNHSLDAWNAFKHFLGL